MTPDPMTLDKMVLDEMVLASISFYGVHCDDLEMPRLQTVVRGGRPRPHVQPGADH